jgi:hypothetical protein
MKLYNIKRYLWERFIRILRLFVENKHIQYANYDNIWYIELFGKMIVVKLITHDYIYWRIGGKMYFDKDIQELKTKHS